MGVISKEQGLLKLVHPGRHVDIHKKPVIAAEILSKYPKYCIARPDVFKFPWIVVRPESILFPGKVFYLVPYRTIYNLLKDKGSTTSPSIQTTTENKSLKYLYRRHHQRHTHQQRRCSCVTNNQDSDDSVSSVTSYVDALTEINHKARDLDIHSYSDSSLAATRRRFSTEELQYCRSSFNSVSTRHSSMHTTSSEVNTGIKSCIRKQNSIRKILNLKVTFG